MADPELTRTVEAMRQRWWPPGSVAVEVVADLDQAIHAAKQALRRVQPQGHWPDVARIAVEAAAPVLLHTTRDRLATLQQVLDRIVRCWDDWDGQDQMGHAIIDARAALDVDPAQENPQ